MRLATRCGKYDWTQCSLSEPMEETCEGMSGVVAMAGEAPSYPLFMKE